MRWGRFFIWCISGYYIKNVVIKMSLFISVWYSEFVLMVLNINGIWYSEKMLLNSSKVISGSEKNENSGFMMGWKIIFFYV